jgi:2-polyprenyl-6-methoxyphenol hydroxylase-like FAD-dependent oxidoreductase
MNLGICDAISLGRMLSEHIKSGVKDTHLLEEYSKKRQTVAREVIELSTKLSDRIGVMTALPGFVRQLIAGVVNHLGFVKKNMVAQISGVVNRVYD